MDTQDNFAILAPLIQLSFAAVFYWLQRTGIESAWRWGLAYGLSALAALLYLPPFDPAIQTVLSDACYLVAYSMFGEAILARHNQPLRRMVRTIVLLAFLGLDLIAVMVFDSLALSVLAVDMGVGVLLGFGLLAWRQMRSSVDITLGLCALLSVAINLLSAITYGLVFPAQVEVAQVFGTEYAYVMQLTGSVFGIWFGLSALATYSLDAMAKYREAADRDPLSGLLNRRGFDVLTKPLIKQGLNGALLTVDIDHFKQINDRYGHDAGDLVLIGLADILRSTLPEKAIIARFGGEEFVVVLPQAPLSEGGALAHAIRVTCAGHDWRPAGIDQQVTVCVGVAEANLDEETWRPAFNRADTALYAAKEAGRNQVMFARNDRLQPISRSAA